MSKIILCRGIPGSGKSTWAKTWVTEKPKERIRINQDDIRRMFGVYWVPERESLVQSACDDIVTRAICKGYDIVIDNMNLNPKTVQHWKDLVEFVKPYGINYNIEFKDFKTPLETCIERDAKRENPIGEKVINSIYNKYKTFYDTNTTVI